MIRTSRRFAWDGSVTLIFAFVELMTYEIEMDGLLLRLRKQCR